MPIFLLTLLAAQLQFSQPVFDPPPKDTVKVVEPYLEKPFIAETIITVDKPPRRIAYSDAEKLYEDSTNNCVLWAKAEVGMPETRRIGDGGREGVQGTEPKVGAIGVQKGIVHAVVVESVNSGMVTFKESNYTKGWITRRTLPESQFIGYIY